MGYFGRGWLDTTRTGRPLSKVNVLITVVNMNVKGKILKFRTKGLYSIWKNLLCGTLNVKGHRESQIYSTSQKGSF